MPSNRVISRSLAAISFAQSCDSFRIVQPKPAASSAQPPYSPACTSSFFGTQPTLTQVPPQYRSSATPTRAPCPAEIRAQRTPADPPPMTNRSKSMWALPLFSRANVWPRPQWRKTIPNLLQTATETSVAKPCPQSIIRAKLPQRLRGNDQNAETPRPDLGPARQPVPQPPRARRGLRRPHLQAIRPRLHVHD